MSLGKLLHKGISVALDGLDATEDAEAAERFHREALTMARIGDGEEFRHPLTPGEHVIQASVDLMKSERLRIDAGTGEIVLQIRTGALWGLTLERVA